MIKTLLLFFLLFSPLLAEDNETSVSDVNQTLVEIEKERNKLLRTYQKNLRVVEEKISPENTWITSYRSYLTYQDVLQSLDEIGSRVKELSRHRNSLEHQDELDSLLSREKVLTDQLEMLRGGSKSPFIKLLKPDEIEERPSIDDPFEIFAGITFIKKNRQSHEDYKKRQKNLSELIIHIREETKIYEDIISISQDEAYLTAYQKLKKKLEKFEIALVTVKTTEEVYQKRIEDVELLTNKDIEAQSIKLFNIGIIIIFLFVLFFLLKLAVKKYITDNERFYMANKIITFANITVVMIVILFNYIENVSYFVTVLGFASAGIAIAMKDWFMSILGWLVIVFGGSIHVGDRIRVDMDGIKYVGDVMDVSLLRITILEDITLTSYYENRRAGRIIFIPNNYVFTRMIANYTHDSLKTVWDGVDITITFDSNHKKAMHLTKEITRKYSKGYTDITRKQLNKLRHKYSLKNTNVEPRIFSFIEDNGLKISSWYLTNAYATLTLRSVISTDILDAFNAEDDITIAYPTQRLHLNDEVRTPPPGLDNVDV